MSVLYVVASAAPPLLRLTEGLRLLRGKGWQTCVILSPTAAGWVDPAEIEGHVEHPVRVRPRLPDEQDPLPKADAVLAAPITFNSLNKWANGISDTLALGLLNEAIGLDIPVTAAPIVKGTLRRHPAYPQSVSVLTSSGVDIIDPTDVTVRSSDGSTTANWQLIADRVGSPRR